HKGEHGGLRRGCSSLDASFPPFLGAWHTHSDRLDVLDSGTRPLHWLGEAPGGRLRHWGRAALELRRVRRGSARIPLRGNPGRASTGKAPGRVSQEPESAATRVVSAASETVNKAARIVGGSPRPSKGDKGPPPPGLLLTYFR
ncbi:hypothetical protein NDU88_002858, partial [Pleurodeles waltl]